MMRLRGDAGNSKVEGFDGDEFLTGRGGDDELSGGVRDDFLNDGAGVNLLVGSTGADRFRFKKSQLGKRRFVEAETTDGATISAEWITRHFGTR